ncbi:hybrid sensor histidine kinase/response regulator (plasmid) [Ampullimonas aquatilis]|uniref:hybrid sensor histidine kinase/response regulator n=1 Tax=Ampullimonas aquatilis TaxID=1341549 RepID=UPI003C77569F
MQLINRYLVAVFVLFFFQLQTNAQGSAKVFPAKSGIALEKLSGYYEYAKDPNGILSIEEIASSRIPFSPLTQTNFGFTNAVYWVRFNINFENYGEENWYLIKNYEHFGKITIYYPNANGQGYSSYSLDEFEHQEGRQYSVRNLLLKVPSSNHTATYYLRFEPRNHSCDVEFQFASLQGVIENTHETQLVLGLFFGALLIMLFYNSILLLYTKDLNYLYYIIYLGGLLVVFADINGYVSLFLDLSTRQRQIAPAALFGLLLGISLFARSFLSLKNTHRKLDYALKALGILIWLGVISSFFLDMGVAYQLGGILTAIIMSLVAYAGVTRSIQGFIPARLYTAGWGVFVFFVIIFILRTRGIIPATFMATYGIQLGAVWEATMFSLALAYRIKLADKDKNDALELERKSLEVKVEERTKSLQAALEARKLIIANASHELRTPVNALSLVLDGHILENHEGTTPEFLHNIGELTSHMRQLVETLLLLDNKEQTPSRNPLLNFNLTDEIKGTADLIQRVRSKDSVRLSIDASACNGFHVRGDLTSFKRIIINLLDNAIKFTDKGSVSVIATIKELSDVSLICSVLVNDTGDGIAAEKTSQIFEAFYTTSGETGHTGTGLGLAMCKKLAENMNGTLRLVQSVQGQGSTFELCVHFELAQNENSKFGLTLFNGKAAEAKRRKVLLVEDDPITAKAVTMIVTQLNHDIELKTDYASAEKALINAMPEYDIALIDHRIPGGKGLDLIKKCKSLEIAKSTQKILVTADVTPELIIEAEGLADDTLTKPVSVAKLRKLLGRGIPLQRREQARPVIDSGALITLKKCGAPYTTLVQMCGSFSTTIENTLSEIKMTSINASNIDGSWKSIRDKVHKIRSSCTSIGAIALDEELKQLSDMTESANFDSQYAKVIIALNETQAALGDALLKIKDEHAI